MFKLLKTNIITFYISLFILRFLRRKSTFVFVASTGRCGTNSISNMFINHPDFISEHEVYPYVLSDNSELSEPDKKALSLPKRKVIAILRSAIKPYYLESSHLFVKNYIEEVVKFLPRQQLKFIHLQRDPVSVASSFYSIGSIPGVTERGKKYLIDPFSSNNIIKLAELEDGGEFEHDLYKCLWYWYELEARVKHYKATLSDYQWFDIKTQELNDAQRMSELVDFVGVNCSDTKESVEVGRKDNAKSKEKKSISDIEPIEMHEKFVNLLKRHQYLS